MAKHITGGKVFIDGIKVKTPSTAVKPGQVVRVSGVGHMTVTLVNTTNKGKFRLTCLRRKDQQEK